MNTGRQRNAPFRVLLHRRYGVAGESLRWNRERDLSVATPYTNGVAGESLRINAKTVMVFYSPGCRECREIMEDFLPKIKETYGDKILIVHYNLDNSESFEFLLELQNRYDKRAKAGKAGFFNPRPPMVFVGNKLLYGAKEIKKELEDEIASPSRSLH